MRTTLRAAALAGAAVLLTATPALAHVTVNSPGATQGGFAKLTFRMPTEKAVPTTRLQVQFPADAPLAFVSVKPHTGWTYSVTKVKAPAGFEAFGEKIDEVVSTITWTATTGAIKPGEFDEFDVSAGPLPERDTLVFKALQTYSDGDVVRWVEERTDATPEPEHPAPVLKLAPATPSASASPTPTAGGASVEAVTLNDLDGTRDRASVGLVLGALGLVLGTTALVRSRRRA